MSEDTAIITAAKWMLKLPFTAMEEGADLTSVSANEIRAIQYNAERHTLERAASCLRHKASVAGQFGLTGERVLLRVAAMYVLELIPETPAPTAGNEEPETKEVNA